MTENNILENAAFVRLPQILKLIPISKSCFWNKVASGDFPAPIKFGRCSFWKSADIKQIIEDIESGKMEVSNND